MKQKKIKLVAVLLLVPILIYFWPTQIYGDTSYIMLIGNSMYPTIESGTFVIAKPDKEYFLGDIIAFVNEDNRNVVHRIVEHTDEGFVTKGDNNSKIDPKIVPLNDVLGRVLFVIPYVGFTSLFLQTSVGMAVFGILALMVFANVKSKSKNKTSGYNSVLIFKVAFIANVVNYVLILSTLSISVHFHKSLIIPFSNYLTPTIASTVFFCMLSIVIFVLYLIDRSIADNKSDNTKYLKLIFSLGGIMIILLQLMSLFNTVPYLIDAFSGGEFLIF